MGLHACCKILASTVVLSLVGCGSSSKSGGTGGATGPGGTTSTGGATGTGGRSGTGGTSASGGTTGTGGTATGGATATGGNGGAVGGRGGGAGATPTGGRGGMAGNAGIGGRGGSTGTGGAAGGGGAGSLMSFFVTSRGPGNGGNLNGSAGADTFCTMLAAAVSPALGAKMWRAYLSTTTQNAHDRIGPGPWRNAAGQLIANNLADLHDQIAANAALNATWSIGSYAVALDERGNQLPMNPLVHDILTGSNADGTLMAGANCNDWTSQSANDVAQIGHMNRMGLAGQPPSWNSVHTVGCAEPTNGADFQVGAVSSGGGRGSLYCFALLP
jgi:hypothetical protein